MNGGGVSRSIKFGSIGYLNNDDGMRGRSVITLLVLAPNLYIDMYIVHSHPTLSSLCVIQNMNFVGVIGANRARVCTLRV